MVEVHMTREECESKIAELILEIQKVHKQYNPYAEDMCNRIITNTIVGDVLVITLFLILSVSAAIVLPKWWKVDKSYMSEEEEFFRIAITFVWACAIFVVCLVSMACIAELKDCLIAPELVIVNKLLEVSQ